MVFIKPTIVRNLEDVRSSTAQKYLYIRADEIMRGVEASESIDSFVGTVLGTPPPQ
jgi:general secretion pathway protein D